MMTRGRAAGLIGAVLAIFVAAAMWSCATAPGAPLRTSGPRPPLGQQPGAYAITRPEVVADPGMLGAMRYREVPRLDLSDALSSSHGRGGLSPFEPTVAPPGPVIAANEEIWVIAKPAGPGRTAATPAPDDRPGCGALVTTLPSPGSAQPPVQVPVPLRHTDVEASIIGYIASVRVRQEFHNPYASKIEAVYLLPLPENAGVNDFLMTVGERRIRGIIRDRQEARDIYEAAKGQGYVASLLEQERPNIFSQAVANIEPGRRIDIDITYFHTLPYSDGAYEFTFPMVVGPRYNPAASTDGIGAVGRGRAGHSGQSTEIQYLRPHERSGADIALRLDLDAGVPVEAISCRTHAVDVARDPADPARARVTLSSLDRVPNRDFVLRYAVAGESVRSTLITQADEAGGAAGGGFFSLMLIPPRELAALARVPVEMVFVVDRSGSMNGAPISLARAAAERGLRLLRPGDSFQVIDFASSASQLGPRPLEATPENIRIGLEYVAGLDASGGTEMVNGLRAALDMPRDPRRVRIVCFLTDGFIGNESDILRVLEERLGDARVFAVGIGSSPNRYLMAEMSRVGRGAVAYVGPGDPAADVMEAFFERACRPALANLSIDWGGAQVSEVTPARLPDLFVGRPVIISGRCRGGWEGTVRVRGVAGHQEQEIAIAAPTAWSGAGTRRGALSSVWARMRIGELAGQGICRPQLAAECALQVRALALSYGLLSPYTSFVAVDSLTRTEGSYGTTVASPVPVPEGTRYETAVGR
jgi:Ca-activated chloride channel family protein